MSIANGQSAAMEFDAQLGGIKLVSPKADPYSNVPKGGGLELPMTIEMPKQPVFGGSRYRWFPAEPVLTEQEDGEDDKAFAKRKRTFEQDVAAWRQEEDAQQQAQEKYERELAAVKGRMLAYAQLVGYGALIGGQRVRVTLQPTSSDLLPGFVALLDAPAEGQ